MPDSSKTLIMKFGGAAVETPHCFARIADLIIARSKFYPKIAIVISAMRGMTDQLIDLALQVNPDPPRREYDMLVSVGERISISLLAMALANKNCFAVSFTGSQSGILTCDNHAEARILDVRPGRLQPHLEAGKCVIVAGFQGVSQRGEITTLGRGGSDTSAVALGIALGAEKVEFFKDVAGIYDEDPKCDPHAKFYPQLNYSDALAVVEKTGGKVLHPRAIRLAQKNQIPLHIFSFKESVIKEGTLITENKSRSEKGVYE